MIALGGGASMSLANARARVLAGVLAVLCGSAAAAQDCGSINGGELDDLAFRGDIRATGLLGLFGRTGVLAFQDGLATWTVGEGAQDLLPACYRVSKAQDGSRFRITMKGRDGGTVEWRGLYDGSTVRDVEAVWTRRKGDFVHDLLLPDAVLLRFTAEAKP